MSKSYSPRNTGLTGGIKVLLVLIGIILAITIYLVWAFVIRTGEQLTSVPLTTASVTTSATETPDETQGKPSAEEQSAFTAAKEAMAALASKPACKSPDEDYQTLVNFAERAKEQGGLSGDNAKLVADALHVINRACDPQHVIALHQKLSAPTAPGELNSLAISEDWVTPTRPASDQAINIPEFFTPDKNIHCLFESGRVACSIYAYSFASQPNSCETFTQSFEVNEIGDPRLTCDWRVLTNVAARDGEYKHGPFACQVRNGGTNVECWSQLTGHGFEFDRHHQRTF